MYKHSFTCIKFYIITQPKYIRIIYIYIYDVQECTSVGLTRRHLCAYAHKSIYTHSTPAYVHTHSNTPHTTHTRMHTCTHTRTCAQALTHRVKNIHICECTVYKYTLTVTFGGSPSPGKHSTGTWSTFPLFSACLEVAKHTRVT